MKPSSSDCGIAVAIVGALVLAADFASAAPLLRHEALAFGHSMVSLLLLGRCQS